MANQEHLRLIRLSVIGWNLWRKDNPDAIPDFRNADLSGSMLSGANLRGAQFQNANLHAAGMMQADLRGADLSNANCSEADFIAANLEGANLTGSNLFEADFTGAIGTYSK